MHALKILIAEDDLMIADTVEEAAIQAGFDVCGIARTVGEAVALGLRHKPDLAVIDLCLADGGLGTELATQLAGSGRIGILYATGNVSKATLGATHGDACIAKPYRTADLIRGLEIVAEIVSSGESSLTFPHGFKLLNPAIKAKQEVPCSEDAIKVQKLLRQQSALARFGSFALRQSELSKVLSEAAQVCAEGLGVPFCKICRYRAEHDDLLIEVGYGWHPGIIGQVVSRADASSPQGRAFITGKPSICNDLRKDATFRLAPLYAEHGVVSTIDVLIRGEDRPYGVLEISATERQNYDDHDVDFLMGFANVLGEAVATSVRTATLQVTVERMKMLVEEKDQLLDQKKILTEELQHRVRNNLQLIYGMLSKHLDDTPDLAAQRGIKAIARRVSTLSQVYDHLSGTEMTSTTDFGSYVKSLCANLVEVQGSPVGTITLDCTTDSIILAHDVVTALGIIVTELVTNSYDHAFIGGRGSIKVSVIRCDEDADIGILSISDDGEGFVPENGGKRQGLGLVWRLIEQVRGNGIVASDHGTAWTVKFPVANIHAAMS
jgi:two-component sensor histidine kinase